VLALYPVFNAIVGTDNAFKAQAVNQGVKMSDLNNLHDRIYIIMIPIITFSVCFVSGLAHSIPIIPTILGAVAAAAVTFLGLLASYLFGETGSRSRVLTLVALIFVGTLADLFIFGGLPYVMEGLYFIVPFILVCVISKSLVARMLGYIQNSYRKILIAGALYNGIIIGTVMYAAALWFWDKFSS